MLSHCSRLVLTSLGLGLLAACATDTPNPLAPSGADAARGGHVTPAYRAVSVGDPSVHESAALAINDDRLVVGYTGTNAFAWTQSGGTVILPTLPGATFTWATDVNNAGVIVGRVTTPTGDHAVY